MIMSEILEIVMVVSFGASWPLNVMKSYKSRTTQGKSLPFLCLIFFGYIAGIASKLLRPMLEFCDMENMVCYLETNKEKNVSLYQHYGFQLAEQRIVPKSNVMHYAMTRKPIPAE